MSQRAVAQAQPKQAPPAVGGVLQRKCACGRHAGGGECEGCRKKRPSDEAAGLGLQRKVAVSEPGDALELEADRIAEAVAGGPFDRRGERVGRVGWIGGPRSPALRIVGSAGPLPAGSGRPLDPATRAFMEPRFRHDFSRVRVHTGPRAGESARALDALAFTSGDHIVFGAGQYSPETTSGRKLLAHELTHVVQQSGSPGTVVQRKGFWGAIGGFFSSFFHLAIDYSDKKIREYLDYLKRNGDIEGDPDSDDKARQIVRDKKHLALPVDIRRLLVSEMLDGWTWGKDERAIIEILRSATPADRTTIVTTIGRAAIWKKIDGRNRRIVEALTLTAADLKDSALVTRLKALSESELVDYQKNVTDPAVAKAIDGWLREKRHELVSYPEAERRKLAVGGVFNASAAESFESDLEAAELQKRKKPAVEQTSTVGAVTKGTVEIIDVPEIAIPASIAFEFETRIGKENRAGLERIARHMISEGTLPANTTRNLAIQKLDRIYRFSRFDHAGAAGFTELALIEEVGPIPPTVEVPLEDWDLNQPRPDAMPTGSLKIRTFDFQRGENWREDEWKLVVEALTSFPDSVLRETAGVTFQRRPCHDDYITNGVCAPREQRTGQVEAGERTGGELGKQTITLFDEAFQTSPSRFGSSTVLVSVLAHEVGHEVDLRPLDVARDTYAKGLKQAQDELDKALAEPEPPKGKRRGKAAGGKSKAELAIDKYDAQVAVLKEELAKARSLGGVADDGGTGAYTDAPAAGDTDFMKAAVRDGLVMTGEKVTSGSITEYGEESIMEQFAELFAVYLTDPELLEAIRPNVYAYFAARFPRGK